MRSIAAAVLVLVGLLAQPLGTASSQGESCRFVLGFAALRERVGTEKVGRCLEDERFNEENGNAEQRTSGGLLVWRKIDNWTAYTDGSSTWLNGPEGLVSRPNSERFAWEKDPISPARSSAAGSPPASASPAAVLSGSGATIAAGSAAAAVTEVAQSAPTATTTPTRAVTSTPTTVATSTATPTKATTATPTPNPLQVKFREIPSEVDTGNDARFEVETNVKEGTCTLAITYRRTPQAVLEWKEIDDDGRCEWKYTLAGDTRTGTATAQVTVTAANGGTVTAEDTFRVRRGDTILSGDIDIEIDADDLPDKVSVGEEFRIAVDTNLKKRGTCEMAVTWPQIGQVIAESQRPDDDGNCSWKSPVPTTITKNGKATLSVIVRKNSSSYRQLTKEFDVRK